MAHSWQRFHWNLDDLSGTSLPELPPFVFRLAETDEREVVLKVVSSALMMERAWTGAEAAFGRDFDKRCEAAFDHEPPACIVVQHGSRVIGASVLDLSDDATFHLLTGPCILHEYRSRGLGSALLGRSLERLREEGVRRAIAMARVNSAAARFVYPKFGSIAEPMEVPKIAA
jgi:GNAT superfamily N-acetyltransferase